MGIWERRWGSLREAGVSGGEQGRVLQLVKDIEAALAKDIEAAEWMAPETKKQAQLEAERGAEQIGYPDSWRTTLRLRWGARAFGRTGSMPPRLSLNVVAKDRAAAGPARNGR